MLKEEQHNPIGQDIHKKEPGKPLRYFTYGDMPFNYGFIPRTWESPDHVDPDTKCSGDGDPIDVVQISSVPTLPGVCQPVRVLGVLALIDQGETDWKILAEPLDSEYGHLSKVPKELKEKVIDWFRNYKTTDGKKQNEFAFNGEIKGAEEAIRIIHECAEQYKQLISDKADQKNHGYWLK
ncbi:inorganic pyrophosphatase [Angomonas deanei]|nr:inorganic pyrophosphatase [Angomonas deanei]|eukprot:EPY41922.1 inorganic pyrophosphatase [Angomonas deanei]